MVRKLRIEPCFWLNCALLLYILPLNLVISVFLASTIHELSHLLAVKACNGKIRQIDLKPYGVVIHADALPSLTSVLCLLAGPLGSLSLIFLSEYFPILSVCGFIQGIFNLIPIYPLDGGRIMYIFISVTSYKNKDLIFHRIENTVSCLVFICVCFFTRSLAISISILCLLLCKRKSSCKEFNIAVQ